MANNYYKGRITVVFAPTKHSPLFGKILPIWGGEHNKGDQINFNIFSLRKNDKFPEESGACEINITDTARWIRKENNGTEFFIPNVPFIVYFKLKVVDQKDGSKRLVAISIFSEDKISQKDKELAEKNTTRPSLNEIMAPAEETMPVEDTRRAIDKLEETLFVNHVKDNAPKMSRKASKEVEEIDEDDDGALLDAIHEEENEQDCALVSYGQTEAVDHSEEEDEEVVEETIDNEEDIDYDEYEKYYEDDRPTKIFKKNKNNQ